MRKMTSVLLALVMVLSVTSLLTVTSNAILEGDWVSTRGANDYDDETDYIPASGYKYTEEGFQTISPDYTNCVPFVQVNTKNSYNLKDHNADNKGNALSVEFTVTEFTYGGEFQDKDHWVCITLNSELMTVPGSVEYGSGLCILLRGDGDGIATAQVHSVDMENKGFYRFTAGTVNPTINEKGQEVYTFSIKHDGTNYVMNICGKEFVDTTGNLNKILDEKCADGAHLGITLFTNDVEQPASLLINEFQGSVPYGEDSAAPEENARVFAEIVDSTTVPAGQPAVKWDCKTEQSKQLRVLNADYTVQDNGAITLKATTPNPYILFTLDNEISYEASDFPIIAVMTKDCMAVDGRFFAMAGKNLGAGEDTQVYFTVEEYYYGDGWGMSYIDLTNDPIWEGRINAIRCDFMGVEYSEDELNTFDVAYFAAFRSLEDAEKYAEDYLIALLGKMPEKEEVTTKEPDTTTPDQPDDTNDATEAPSDDDTATEPGKSGNCKSVVALPVVVLFATMAVALVAKKKD